jgi:predicted Fe-S protein YdhL (DUF1289 family)
MISPCILVCAMDDATGLCVGCGRTGDEIGAWTLYTEAERAAVMAALPARMPAIERKPQHEMRRRIVRGGLEP